MSPPADDPRPVVGVDVGATLAKLAVRDPGGRLRFDFLPAHALEAVSHRVRALAPRSVGVTGCGAGQLEPHLHVTPRRLIEFEAWGRGSRELLRAQGIDTSAPYLLVSVGTGTSVLRIEGDAVTRIGGTGLGGGTVLGLGVALTGCVSYEELCELARRGRRGNVDLLIGDIYAPGEIALPAEATAAAFGSLARWLSGEPGRPGSPESKNDPSRREDLAAAVMGLVGENVALIACGLAGGADVHRVVFGGATLLGNEALRAVLVGVTAALGREPLLLDEAGYAGALGALGLAAETAATD
jgi:type II pantothenate kinase